jgi:hypothetical protein
MSSIRLHPVHGVAPILVACRLCRGDCGLILAGAQAEKIARDAYNCSYEQMGTRSIITGDICTKCQKLLSDGAAAFVTKDGGSTLMLSAEWAKRNQDEHLHPGKVHVMTEEQMAKFKVQIGVKDEQSAKSGSANP